MDLLIRVIGKMIKLMVQVNLHIQTVQRIMAVGLMIKLMDMVFSCIQKSIDMRASGKTTYNMVKEKKYGLMAQFLKVGSFWE